MRRCAATSETGQGCEDPVVDAEIETQGRFRSLVPVDFVAQSFCDMRPLSSTMRTNMYRLELRNSHKSIDDIPADLVFDEFVILTGVNGSGKSHLLEASDRGDVAVVHADGQTIPPDAIQLFTWLSLHAGSASTADATSILRTYWDSWERVANWKNDPSRLDPLMAQLQEAQIKTGHLSADDVFGMSETSFFRRSALDGQSLDDAWTKFKKTRDSHANTFQKQVMRTQPALERALVLAAHRLEKHPTEATKREFERETLTALVVRRGIDLVGQGNPASSGLGDDVVGRLGPHERSRVVVPV